MSQSLRRLKVAASDRVGAGFLEYLAQDPEANFQRILDVGLKLAPLASHRQMFSSLRRLYETDSVVRDATRRLMDFTSPLSRKGFVLNTVLHASLFGVPEQKRRGEELGIQVPFTILIDPTEACNLRCHGCWAGRYSPRTLAEKEMNRIILEAKDLGIYFIVLSGGEPFLYEPLLDVVARHPDVAFMAYTNGTLIDDEVADRLAALGNLSPAISLEGNREFTDARRGQGVFDQVMRAMDRLRERKVPFGFSVTATRHNVGHIFSDAFIDLMVSKGALYGWSFHYVPVGRDASVDLMLTPEQRGWLALRVPEIRRTRGLLLADFWNDGELTHGCIAGGRRYFHINANGDAEPCAFAHFATDNIKGKSLVEVLRSPLFRAFQDRQPFGDNLLRPCPIIDHPETLREMVQESSALPTHDGADHIFQGCMFRQLVEKARGWEEVATRLWGKRLCPGEPVEGEARITVHGT